MYLLETHVKFVLLNHFLLFLRILVLYMNEWYPSMYTDHEGQNKRYKI